MVYIMLKGWNYFRDYLGILFLRWVYYKVVFLLDVGIILGNRFLFLFLRRVLKFVCYWCYGLFVIFIKICIL